MATATLRGCKTEEEKRDQIKRLSMKMFSKYGSPSTAIRKVLAGKVRESRFVIYLNIRQMDMAA